ncbi:MAG: hypothetical protein ABH831_02980 [Candidatus Nealsonbacteria bacterium]
MKNKASLHWEIEPQKQKEETINKKTYWADFWMLKTKVLIVFLILSVLSYLIQKEFISAAISLIFGSMYIVLLRGMVRIGKKTESLTKAMQVKNIRVHGITIIILSFLNFLIIYYFSGK